MKKRLFLIASGVGTSVAALLTAATSHAAADAELVNTASDVGTIVKENGLAVIGAVIGLVIIVPLATWAIKWGMGFLRRR